MKTLKQFALASVAMALAPLAGTALAQSDYPSRPISLVVPFAAGGPTDVLARALAVTLTKNLKQSVVVENAVGAGGTIASQKVAQSKPDGYTVLIHHMGMATAPHLYRKLSFDPMTSYEYIGQVADVPMTVIAKPGMAPNNLTELIAYLKANKDKVSMANAGPGAVSHLCGMLFMSAIQTDFTTVPYKGTGPAFNDLLGGQVDFMCDQTTQTLPHIKGGKVKAYGVTTSTRLKELNEVPTLAEQGLKDFNLAVWHGMYVAKGTPKDVTAKITKALQDSLKDADFAGKVAGLAAQVVSQDKATPENLQAHLKNEIAKWGPVIRKNGQYLD